MSDKIIILDDKFATGEPTVQLISTRGHGNRVLREATSVHKIASIKSPALDYINSIEPEEGKSIVLIVGLGDHETYGPNRNGDGFPSEPVANKIASDEVLSKHYKSYDNAHVFEHHVNTDPSKAIGRVKKAFWNPYMRRVEVVEDFDHARAPDLLEKIAAGDYPAKSMGCRIKYDVCSNCGNQAQTRAQYCDHLKFAMSQIDPETGIQNAALNPSPNFFDSSWVKRPADRTGYMLKKVARVSAYEIRGSSLELGELKNELLSKVAEASKSADLEKIVQGEPAASVSSLDADDAALAENYVSSCGDTETEPASSKTVSILINYKPSEVMGTAEDSGMPLSVGNLLKYFTERMQSGGCDAVTPEVEKSASQHLLPILNIFAAYPRFYSTLVKGAGLDTPLTLNTELQQKLAFEASTPTQDYFSRRLMPASMRGQERGRTDMVSWTDPNTGQQHNTNYGAVQKTNDSLVEHGLKQKANKALPLLGAGALLSGAGYLMGRNPKTRGLAQAATVLGGVGTTAAGLGKAFETNQLAGPKVRSDQGETISGWTEMVPKRASVMASEITFLRHRLCDTQGTLDKRASALLLQEIKSAEVIDELAPLLGATLNLDHVAQCVGNSIVRAIR